MEGRITSNTFLHSTYQGEGIKSPINSSLWSLIFGPFQPVGKYKYVKMKGIHVYLSKFNKAGWFAMCLYVKYTDLLLF